MEPDIGLVELQDGGFWVMGKNGGERKKVQMEAGGGRDSVWNVRNGDEGGRRSWNLMSEEGDKWKHKRDDGK